MSKFDHLSARIVELSVADNWDEAKSEWEFKQVVLAEEPEKCLCTHYPIRELCYIKNEQKGTRAMVGNCCVKHFFGLDEPSTIFQSLKRVDSDPRRSLGKTAIRYAAEQHIFNTWETRFYLNTVAKRKLSLKQATKRAELNKKFCSALRPARNTP